VVVSVNGITLRALLYVGIAMFTPLAALYVEAAASGCWPTLLELVAVGLTGIVNSLLALRAYFDGSAERSRNGGG